MNDHEPQAGCRLLRHAPSAGTSPPPCSGQVSTTRGEIPRPAGTCAWRLSSLRRLAASTCLMTSVRTRKAGAMIWLICRDTCLVDQGSLPRRAGLQGSDCGELGERVPEDGAGVPNGRERGPRRVLLPGRPLVRSRRVSQDPVSRSAILLVPPRVVTTNHPHSRHRSTPGPARSYSRSGTAPPRRPAGQTDCAVGP
jgi:hypothetical protein